MTQAEPTSRIILGMSWATGEPLVRVADDGANTSEMRAVAGLRLNYETGPEAPRRCVGRTPFRKADAAHTDCPNRPEPGSRLCTQCSISDATFASNLHHAHTRDRADIDPAIAEHLRQPNLLYLAAFRDGSLKVGTSTATRVTKRLCEQGAWHARLVARTDDGYAVRDIEDRVTEEMGLPQSVAIGRKLAGMAAPIPDERLLTELGHFTAGVHALIQRMGDRRVHRHDEAWTFPSAPHPVWRGLHTYPLKLDSGRHDLECIDACGRMIAVRRPDTGDEFIADLGRLYGVELALGDYESDELAVQDSLF